MPYAFNPSGELTADLSGFPGGDYLQKAHRELDLLGGSGLPAANPPMLRQSPSEWARMFSLIQNGILEDCTAHLDPAMLRALAKRNPAVRLVLGKITSWILPHFRRQARENSVCMRVMQRDVNKSMTPVAAREARRIEDILHHGGMITQNPITGEPGAWDGYAERKALTLDSSIKMLLYDSFVLDRAFIETEGSAPRRDGGQKQPVMWWCPFDGALIRRVDTPNYRPAIRNGSNNTDDIAEQVKYVQLNPGTFYQVNKEYTWRDGEMLIRNPRTEFLAFGYGESELEMALMIIIGVLYCLQSNQDWFNRNFVPQGILTLIGNYDKKDIQTLRTQLRQEIGYGGGGGLYNFPILAAPADRGGRGAEWTPLLDRTRFDMVSKTYYELCMAVICAMEDLAPEAVGHSSFGGPQTSLGDGDPETVITESKHSCVLPRVHQVLSFLNRGIVHRINEDFEARIDGLESMYNTQLLVEAQLDQAHLMGGRTINMNRAERNLPPMVVPLDQPLWRKIEARHLAKFYPDDTSRLWAIVEEYEEKGGQRSKYPDAPIGNALAFQQWQTDSGQQDAQGVKDQMGQLAGQEAGHQQGMQQQEQQDTRNAMGQQVAQDQASQSEEEGEGRKAKVAGELRVPGLADALHKAQPNGHSDDVIIRIGGWQ